VEAPGTLNSSPEPTDHGALPDYKESDWLLEEYKLLTTHCCHEDGELKKTLGMFLTLNTALLGFAASSLAARDAESRWIVPVAGLLLWLAWIPSMVRIRAFRNYFEYRIRAIEHALHTLWDRAEHAAAPADGIAPVSAPSEPSATTPASGVRALDIRSFRRWPGGRSDWPPEGIGKYLHRWFGKWPTSLTYLALPCGFLILWLVLLGMRLSWWAVPFGAVGVVLVYAIPVLLRDDKREFREGV
jgi:hypothetical protein